MIDQLMAAVSGANTALDMLKRGIEIHDQKVAENAVADMTESLRAVTTNAFDAVQDALRSAQEARGLDRRIAELEKEVAALKAAAEERDLYHLVSLSPNSFAYSLKVPVQGQPPHYLCQACYDGGKKVVLQRPGGRSYLECSECEAQIHSSALRAELRAGMQSTATFGRRSRSWMDN